MKSEFRTAGLLYVFALWQPCYCDKDYTIWKAIAFPEEFISLSASLLDFGPLLTAASLLKNCLPTMNKSSPVFANTDLSPFDDLVKTQTFHDPILKNLLVVGFEFIYALQRQVSDPYFLAAYNVSDLMVKADKFFDGIKGGLFPYDPNYDWGKVESNGKVLAKNITDFLLSGILDISGLRAIIRTDRVDIIGIMTYLRAVGLPFRDDLPSIIIHSADLYFLLPTWEAIAIPEDRPIGGRDGILPSIIFSVADNVKRYGILLNLRTSYWVGNQLMNICPECTAASQALFSSCVKDDAGMAEVVAKMAEMLDGQTMSVYLAPPCRLELLATSQLAAQYNITMVTGSGELIGNSSKFPYTIRTGYSPIWFWEGFVEFSKRLNWTNFFIVYDDMSTGLADPMTKIIGAEGLMTMLHWNNMTGILVRHHTVDDILPNLLLLQKSARSRSLLRSYMMRAYDMGMCDGSYAFVGFQSYEDFLEDDYGFVWNDTTDASNDAKLRVAYDSLLIAGQLDYSQGSPAWDTLRAKIVATFGPSYANPTSKPKFSYIFFFGENYNTWAWEWFALTGSRNRICPVLLLHDFLKNPLPPVFANANHLSNPPNLPPEGGPFDFL